MFLCAVYAASCVLSQSIKQENVSRLLPKTAAGLSPFVLQTHGGTTVLCRSTDQHCHDSLLLFTDRSVRFGPSLNCHFYRAMLRRARLWNCMSSVRLSVTFRYRDHIVGWNSSKIISRPNSVRHMRSLTPTWAIWCNAGTPPKLGWNTGGVRST